MLKTAIRERRFPAIDWGSSVLSSWPGGKYPYIFGSGFYRFLGQTYGEEIPYRLEISHSRMVLPFLISLNSKNILGKSYPALWREWEGSLRAESPPPRAQKLEIPEPKPITYSHEFTYGGNTHPRAERSFTPRKPRANTRAFFRFRARQLLPRKSWSSATPGPP